MTGLGGQSFEIVSFHYGEMWRGVEGADKNSSGNVPKKASRKEAW